MTLEECKGNYNYMYMFRITDNWYPCHITKADWDVDPKEVIIYTRNGTIMREKRKNVRKMSQSEYLCQRTQDIRMFGEFAYEHGYHEMESEDLEKFRESNQLEGELS